MVLLLSLRLGLRLRLLIQALLARRVVLIAIAGGLGLAVGRGL